jgi:ribonuclease/clavin/mitogillin
MMIHHVHEKVHYWQVARSFAGKYLYSTGFFLVEPYLIDCGPVNMAGPLKTLFSQIPASKILITHHHEDHSGNLHRLVSQQGFQAFAHSRSTELLEQVSREIPFYRNLIWGRPLAVKLQEIPKIIETANYGFEVLETPGHSADHICLFERTKLWLFTGDLYLASYLRYLREDEDIYEIMSSLRRLIDVKPAFLFCSHRGVIPEGEKQLSKKLSFLEELRDQVLKSQEKGIPVQDFLNTSSLKPDRFFRWLSRGEFSTANLVRAFIR